MTLEQLASIATIAEVFIVFVSLLFIWWQVRESTRIARAENVSNLVETVYPFHMAMIENRELTQLWASGRHQADSMDMLDRYRYQQLLTWWLMLHENIYYQHQQRLIDDSMYSAWRADLRNTIRAHHLATNWADIKTIFQKDFSDHVERLIEDTHATQ